MGRGKYGKEDKTVREHDDNIMAVHRVTGKLFGGKSTGTQVGYSKIGPLKAAMTLAEVNPDEFMFIKVSFTEGSFSRPTPTLTYLEG